MAFKLRTLHPPGKELPVLNRKLSGLQSASGYYDQQKNLQPVQEIETDSSVVQLSLATMSTGLSQLP